MAAWKIAPALAAGMIKIIVIIIIIVIIVVIITQVIVAL